jgi:uncharacterized protein (DUF488 family)
MAEAAEVMTIGYQGHSVESFLNTLEAASVELLLDIRSKPVSRKPGFSKIALARNLAERGITYRHVPDLGMPLHLLRIKPTLRGNDLILSAYRTQLPDKLESLNLVVDEASVNRTCLLCFEADASQCHRSVVAEHLREERQLTITHL